MGAEAEVRRERKGAGWAEEGRRGVGGLVERGSGAVWRYAGCLCGLSRGLIRYDSPVDGGVGLRDGGVGLVDGKARVMDGVYEHRELKRERRRRRGRDSRSRFS